MVQVHYGEGVAIHIGTLAEQIQLAIAADWLAQQPVTLGLPLETALGVLFDC